MSRYPRARRFIKRALLGIAALTLGVVTAGVGLGCCAFSSPGYNGPASDHFDGERFHNQEPRERAGFFGVVEWQLSREPGPWREWTDAEPGPRPPDRVGIGQMRVTFINHATTLIQMDGLNILTDPVWSDLIGPASLVGPSRVRPPGLRFEDLPPIDAIIVSHNHYDHMDLPTLKRLALAHRPRIFAGLGTERLFYDEGVPGSTDLDWWQGIDLAPGVRVTAVPAAHFSNRGLCDRDTTLWAGFVLSGPSGVAYFAGDTGDGPHFGQIRERFGKVRLAILPIGAYLPRWFMAPVHLDPAGAVGAHQALGAATSLAIHYGTFKLADEGQDQPLVDLQAALDSASVPASRFWALGFGEGRDVPPADTAQ